MYKTKYVTREDWIKHVRAHGVRENIIEGTELSAVQWYDAQEQITAGAIYRKPLPGTTVNPTYAIYVEE